MAAYAGFILVLTGVWGVFLFPSDEIIRHVQCRFSQMAPDATLSIGRLGLTLPPGMVLEDIAVMLKNKTAFQAGQMHILPGLVSLFQDRSKHHLSARLALAEIRMELPLPVIDSFQFRHIRADIDWQADKLRIDALTAEGDQLDGSLSGRIQVKMPFGKSRFQVAGVVHLKPEVLTRLKAGFPGGIIPDPKTDDGGISFEIAGTIEAPMFSFK